jgi:hypothetical protein
LRRNHRSIALDCRQTCLPKLKIRTSWIPEGLKVVSQLEPDVLRVRFRKTFLDDDYEMYRSSSVDLSNISRDRYLSRWSRENTPVDSHDTYQRYVRRSFTPVREISSYEVIPDRRRAYSVDRYRTPIGLVTKPFHTNQNYYSESQPIRKYDVFQVRTWSYPIYKLTEYASSACKRNCTTPTRGHRRGNTHTDEVNISAHRHKSARDLCRGLPTSTPTDSVCE